MFAWVDFHLFQLQMRLSWIVKNSKLSIKVAIPFEAIQWKSCKV
jgi:hypothetical protein